MDDLTKVGHVPRRKGAHKTVSLLRPFHCIDHTSFRDSCHPCLVVAVEGLAISVVELQNQSHIHEEQPSIPYSVRGKIEPGTGLPYI